MRIVLYFIYSLWHKLRFGHLLLHNGLGWSHRWPLFFHKAFLVHRMTPKLDLNPFHPCFSFFIGEVSNNMSDLLRSPLRLDWTWQLGFLKPAFFSLSAKNFWLSKTIQRLATFRKLVILAFMPHYSQFLQPAQALIMLRSSMCWIRHQLDKWSEVEPTWLPSSNQEAVEKTEPQKSG